MLLTDSIATLQAIIFVSMTDSTATTREFIANTGNLMIASAQQQKHQQRATIGGVGDKRR
jgi:hypothetical protein